MKKIKNLAELGLIVLFCSLIPLWDRVDIHVFPKVLISIVLSVIFLIIMFRGGRDDSGSRRLKRLSRGISLLRLTSWSVLIQVGVLILFFSCHWQTGVVNGIFAVVMPVLALALLMLDAVFRIILNARQIKLKDYVMLLCLWWMPLVNIFIIRRSYKIAVREYNVESNRLELENARAECEICRTKYPVILIHGIFFRDWQFFNYWHRIPAALIRNGGQIYYGRQQSAASLQRSGSDISRTILQVIQETGAEKVNLIAHSKGGLDCRYAISCLGMDKYVATLTTVGTPHKGCDMVDLFLKKLPDKLVRSVADRYNKIFTRLGDDTPDFMAGIQGLSAERAKYYDSEMPDSPDVSYRSVMTLMESSFSAGFPLNIGYLVIKKLNGENDGLVWTDSAVHGDHRLIRPAAKRGISHGDMIDLNRENIRGFDVREFYVDMLFRLRQEGF